MRQDLQYLYNVANQFIGKLRVRDYATSGAVLDGQDLASLCWGGVKADLSKWSPEKLGKLAALGRGFGRDDGQVVEQFQPHRTSLYELHCGTWLGKYDNGHTLLLDIATGTVVAAMVDVIEGERKDGSLQKPSKPHGMPIPDARDYEPGGKLFRRVSSRA
ncbi:MAG: hypothetical protein WCI89_03400 [bacterium]